MLGPTGAQVREMLRHFHEVRGKANRLGGNLLDEHRAGFYFWATLQSHSVAVSWLKTDFKHHSRVAPLLNQHLFEHRVPRAMFDALRDSVTQLEEDTRKAQKTADQAKTGSGGGGAAAAKKGKGAAPAPPDE
jgi:hypothetical protein